MERSLIVESRYARNYISKFQAEFHVPEENPGVPRLGPPPAPVNTPSPSKYPPPFAFPMGVSLKQAKPLV